MSLSRFDEAAKSFLELLADVVDMRSSASSVGVYCDFHLFALIPSKPSLSTENLSRSRACDIKGRSTDLILEKELTE